MEKIIIQNESDLPMSHVLRLVEDVVKMGRISNNEKQYCYLAAYTVGEKKYHIVSDLNEKSDKFTIYQVPPHNIILTDKGEILFEEQSGPNVWGRDI